MNFKKLGLGLVGLGLLGLAAVFLAGGFSRKLVLRTYEIESEKIQSPLRICQISDLHSSYYGQGQGELLDAIRDLDPDLLVFTGDIIDEDLPIFPALTTIEALGQAYPSYYVTGNHEYRTGALDFIKDCFIQAQIQVLEGDSHVLDLASSRICLGGVDDLAQGLSSFKGQINRLALNKEPDLFNLVLCHRPEAYIYFQDLGPDLILSGHAHGGQWRLPGILNGLLAPGQGLFPKYAGGLYDLENFQLLVSRGLALDSTWVPRIFNPPELVVIELLPKNM